MSQWGCFFFLQCGNVLCGCTGISLRQECGLAQKKDPAGRWTLNERTEHLCGGFKVTMTIMFVIHRRELESWSCSSRLMSWKSRLDQSMTGIPTLKLPFQMTPFPGIPKIPFLKTPFPRIPKIPFPVIHRMTTTAWVLLSLLMIWTEFFKVCNVWYISLFNPFENKELTRNFYRSSIPDCTYSVQHVSWRRVTDSIAKNSGGNK